MLSSIPVMFGTCLLLSVIPIPAVRKMISTSVGLYLGFHSVGFGYIFVVLTFIASWLPIMLFPRYHASILSTLISFAAMMFFNYADYMQSIQIIDNSFIIMITVNFTKVHMTMTNYRNAGLLGDGEKSKSLT